MKRTHTIISCTAAETAALAEKIGRAVPPGTVLAVSGTLGAGKTVFAAGLAKGLGVSDLVTSPTYLFFQEYQGRLPFCHIDAYRMEHLSEEEIALIGIEECFLGDRVVLVEWPQFMADWLPGTRIEIAICHTDAVDKRQIEICYDEERDCWLHESFSN